MAVETSQVIVVSPRRQAQDGTFSLPGRIGEPNTEFVAFAGTAKINIARVGFFKTRRSIELINISAVSALHPLANSISQTHIGYIGEGDIVAEIGDPASILQAERRLNEIGKSVACIRRGPAITSTEIVPSGKSNGRIVIENL